MDAVVNWIGAVTGIISIFTLVYLLAVKLTSIETKVTLMWDVLIVSQLEKGVDKGLVQHESPYSINGDFYKRLMSNDQPLPHQFKQLMDSITKRNVPEDYGDTVVLINKHISIEGIANCARQLDFTTVECLAYLITVLQQKE